VESLLRDAEVYALQIRVPVRNGHNFWSDRWIALKFLREFPDSIFAGVVVESLHGDAGISKISNCRIALKFLQEFPDAVFLGVDVESLQGEAEVSALPTRVPV
jgi:hypothetical protein